MSDTNIPGPAVAECDEAHAAECLAYEIEMLFRTGRLILRTERLILSTQTPPECQTIRNALLEAFGVHFRVLSEFLFSAPKSRYPDDIYACRFITDWESPGGDTSKWPEPFKEHFERVGSEICHLSMKRKRADELRPWEVRRLLEAAREKLNEFMNARRRSFSDGVARRIDEELNAPLPPSETLEAWRLAGATGPGPSLPFNPSTATVTMRSGSHHTPSDLEEESGS